MNVCLSYLCMYLAHRGTVNLLKLKMHLKSNLSLLDVTPSSHHFGSLLRFKEAFLQRVFCADLLCFLFCCSVQLFFLFLLSWRLPNPVVNSQTYCVISEAFDSRLCLLPWTSSTLLGSSHHQHLFLLSLLYRHSSPYRSLDVSLLKVQSGPLLHLHALPRWSHPTSWIHVAPSISTLITPR